MDKPDELMMPKPHIAATRSHSTACASNRSIDRRIRAFLNGEGHGQDVLGALYGHAVAEPVPERLRALLKR